MMKSLQAPASNVDDTNGLIMKPIDESMKEKDSDDVDVYNATQIRKSTECDGEEKIQKFKDCFDFLLSFWSIVPRHGLSTYLPHASRISICTNSVENRYCESCESCNGKCRNPISSSISIVNDPSPQKL